MNLNTEMAVNRISEHVERFPIGKIRHASACMDACDREDPCPYDMDSGVFKQIANVLCLPAIRRYVLCRPKGHWGYGFPIDSVAARRTQTPYEAATLPVSEAIAH